MTDMHDLAAPYALDALDGDERARYEAHLTQCATCRRDVGRFSESIAAFAEAGAVAPPAHLKERVMASIEAAAHPDVIIPLRHPRRSRLTAFAVAALFALILATIAIAQSSGAASIEDVLAAGDARTFEVTTKEIAATFVYSPSHDAGVFQSDTLAAPTPGTVYELWLIGDAGPTPAGLFVPGKSGRSVALVEAVEPGLVLGLTLEPDGGSPQPTGEVLFTLPIT